MIQGTLGHSEKIGCHKEGNNFSKSENNIVGLQIYNSVISLAHGNLF